MKKMVIVVLFILLVSAVSVSAECDGFWGKLGCFFAGEDALVGKSTEVPECSRGSTEECNEYLVELEQSCVRGWDTVSCFEYAQIYDWAAERYDFPIEPSADTALEYYEIACDRGYDDGCLQYEYISGHGAGDESSDEYDYDDDLVEDISGSSSLDDLRTDCVADGTGCDTYEAALAESCENGNYNDCYDLGFELSNDHNAQFFPNEVQSNAYFAEACLGGVDEACDALPSDYELPSAESYEPAGSYGDELEEGGSGENDERVSDPYSNRRVDFTVPRLESSLEVSCALEWTNSCVEYSASLSYEEQHQFNEEVSELRRISMMDLDEIYAIAASGNSDHDEIYVALGALERIAVSGGEDEGESIRLLTSYLISHRGRSFANSIDLYREACERGSGEACDIVGNHYSLGHGSDLSQGFLYYYQGCSQPIHRSEDACSKIGIQDGDSVDSLDTVQERLEASCTQSPESDDCDILQLYRAIEERGDCDTFTGGAIHGLATCVGSAIAVTMVAVSQSSEEGEDTEDAPTESEEEAAEEEEAATSEEGECPWYNPGCWVKAVTDLFAEEEEEPAAEIDSIISRLQQAGWNEHQIEGLTNVLTDDQLRAVILEGKDIIRQRSDGQWMEITRSPSGAVDYILIDPPLEGVKQDTSSEPAPTDAYTYSDDGSTINIDDEEYYQDDDGTWRVKEGWIRWGDDPVTDEALLVTLNAAQENAPEIDQCKLFCVLGNFAANAADALNPWSGDEEVEPAVVVGDEEVDEEAETTTQPLSDADRAQLRARVTELGGSLTNQQITDLKDGAVYFVVDGQQYKVRIERSGNVAITGGNINEVIETGSAAATVAGDVFDIAKGIASSHGDTVGGDEEVDGADEDDEEPQPHLLNDQGTVYLYNEDGVPIGDPITDADLVDALTQAQAAQGNMLDLFVQDNGEWFIIGANGGPVGEPITHPGVLSYITAGLTGTAEASATTAAESTETSAEETAVAETSEVEDDPDKAEEVTVPLPPPPIETVKELAAECAAKTGAVCDPADVCYSDPECITAYTVAFNDAENPSGTLVVEGEPAADEETELEPAEEEETEEEAEDEEEVDLEPVVTAPVQAPKEVTVSEQVTVTYNAETNVIETTGGKEFVQNVDGVWSSETGEVVDPSNTALIEWLEAAQVQGQAAAASGEPVDTEGNLVINLPDIGLPGELEETPSGEPEERGSTLETIDFPRIGQMVEEGNLDAGAETLQTVFDSTGETIEVTRNNVNYEFRDGQWYEVQGGLIQDIPVESDDLASQLTIQALAETAEGLAESTGPTTVEEEAPSEEQVQAAREEAAQEARRAASLQNEAGIMQALQRGEITTGEAWNALGDLEAAWEDDEDIQDYIEAVELIEDDFDNGIAGADIEELDELAEILGFERPEGMTDEEYRDELEAAIREGGSDAQRAAEIAQLRDSLRWQRNWAEDLLGSEWYGVLLQGDSPVGEVGSTLAGVTGNLGQYRSLSNLLLPNVTKDWGRWADETFGGLADWDGALARDMCEYDDARSHKKPGEASAFIHTPSGTYQFVGSIHAERSDNPSPILCEFNPDPDAEEQYYCSGDLECQDETFCYQGNQVAEGFFYKITWAVSAPQDEKHTPYIDENGQAVKFNLQIDNQWIFQTPTLQGTQVLTLNNGGRDGGTIIRYLPYEASQVCIVFDTQYRVNDDEGTPVKHICASFIISNSGVAEYGGSSRAPPASITSRSEEVSMTI